MRADVDTSIRKGTDMGILSNGFRATRALAGMGMAAALAATLMASTAQADTRNVATYGVDLTPEQHAQVERFFGTGATGAEVIYVNNDQEREYLSAYIPLEQIGDKTYSCALVQPTTSGGIHVKTANLTYVTSDMIASTLATAGVTNCDVIAVCPFKVSGTGALTGVMLAYEQASGQALDPAKKDLANQEMITTGTLAETVGPDVATLIVNNVKADVIQQGVTETTEINNIVNNVVNNIVNDNSTTTNIDNSSTSIDNSTTNVTIETGSAVADSDDSAASDAGKTENAGKAESAGTPAVQLSDEEMQALKDFAQALAEQGYSYDDMKETLEMVSKNASEAAGVTDPLAPAKTGENGAASSRVDKSTASDATDGTTTPPAASAPAPETPEALPEDSILNTTDDTALGAGTVVDSTDLSTIGDGVETRQEAEAAAAQAAEQPATADDPFASLSWDETTTGGDATSMTSVSASTSSSTSTSSETTVVTSTAPANATPDPGVAATPGAVSSDVSAPVTLSASADATASVATVAEKLAGAPMTDALGLPTSAQAAGLPLTLQNVMVATDMVEHMTEPLIVTGTTPADGAATNALYGLVTPDGTKVTDAVYVAGGITGVGDDWILATREDKSHDLLCLTDDPLSPQLVLVSHLAPGDVQVRAKGSYANIQTQTGIEAIDTSGNAAGTPMALDDFSYAEGVAEEAAGADVVKAGADALATEATSGETDTLAAGAISAEADTLGTGVMVTALPAQPEDAATVQLAVPAALPADSTAVDGTDGALWLVKDALTGKVTVCDAAGANVFGMTFDKVQVAVDQSDVWLLVTDKNADESALYEVALV